MISQPLSSGNSLVLPPLEVGFYGKLPSHGDFLRRRVSDQFVATWDAWLQASLNASRSALGDKWLDLYLTSPVWRFACAPGACGDLATVGVLVPSVDRVGRYFPLTLVAGLPVTTDVPSAAIAAEVFFQLAEQLAVDVLADDRVDFDKFDRDVEALAAELGRALRPPAVSLDPSCGAILDVGTEGWQIPIGTSRDLQSGLWQVVGRRLSSVYHPVVLLWTDGSEAVESSCLVNKGLPRADAFTALLDGRWREARWQTATAMMSPQPPSLADELTAEITVLQLRSKALSDRGRVRERNQDAFLEAPSTGLWAVADGLGGYSDGEVASRMVCDALADLPPKPTLETLVQSVEARLREVNGQLAHAADRIINPVRSASTVVALLVRGGQCAVLWAGDSRVYRLRAGVLEQITTDHATDDAVAAASTAITRAVGAEAEIEFDVRREPIAPGDRFLLCSDGLYRAVHSDRLAELTAVADLTDAVRGLVDAALMGGAPDNVTVLVVDVTA